MESILSPCEKKITSLKTIFQGAFLVIPKPKITESPPSGPFRPLTFHTAIRKMPAWREIGFPIRTFVFFAVF
jgi:hypothetical protein